MVREEEAAMNDDSTNIYNSCSDSYNNNRIGDENCNLNQVWGTWEELLLTYAVKRHGFGDWDSVAKEVRSRCSLNASPEDCSLKYVDLKRRFHDSVDGGGGGDYGERNSNAAKEEDGEIPWMEELRSLRVAELRQEVRRYDDSILSLQLKVKRLEEEKDGNRNPDLEDDRNNETEPAKLNRETSESDRDNRSMNESNSTGSVDKSTDHQRLGGDKMIQACENSRNPDPDPVYKEVEEAVSKGSKMSPSGELGESGTSTGRGKRKGGKYRSGEDSSIRGGDIKLAYNKSQPLIEIIELIRSHPSGSLFETRLRSQETKKYKSLIKQHLDIKMIEKKLEKGSYVSSSISFYRDIKLLFTNAIVFFPPSSSESLAAQELRTLVSNEIKKQTGKSGHSFIKVENESSVSRQKSSGLPLVVCKKKSSTSKKTTSPSSRSKQNDEKKSQEVLEEKTLTNSISGARSSRRTSKGKAKKPTNSKTDSSNEEEDEKEEIVKTEKKMTSDKKKSVADFLKRIKKNSPEKEKETTSKNQKKSDGNKSKTKPMKLRSNSTSKIKVEVEDNKSTSKRKKPKKEAKTTGKRSRESEEDNKQPKKRKRR